MELKDLVGEGVLDAVDFDSERTESWSGGEDCSVVRFRLNGIVYVARENPDDGYRSSMREIVVSDKPVTNVFPATGVVVSHRTEGTYGSVDDILEFFDSVTGCLVLEIGTRNTDDYYPSFVGAFHPEALACNAKKTA